MITTWKGRLSISDKGKQNSSGDGDKKKHQLPTFRVYIQRKLLYAQHTRTIAVEQSYTFLYDRTSPSAFSRASLKNDKGRVKTALIISMFTPITLELPLMFFDSCDSLLASLLKLHMISKSFENDRIDFDPLVSSFWQKSEENLSISVSRSLKILREKLRENTNSCVVYSWTFF